MSIQDQVARLNTVAQSIPLGALRQLSESTLPPEVLVARNGMSGLGAAVIEILGNTHDASQAQQLLSHAIAMLDQAAQAHQVLLTHYSKALTSATRAQQHIEHAVMYHGHGAGAS
ncbi:hypothetical protein [Amycolatopsis sp. NPDC051102]|uniref:hypothetical protein n=1 Tax=Amycolatopsis sp. NPDC051102 TaxID=3155163 RepID=UPI003445FF49